MWKLLSYKLSDNLSAYKDGKRIKIIEDKKINNKDSCNQTSIDLPTHFGTHIDFPFHFDNNGLKAEDYNPDYFFFYKPQIVHIESELDGKKIINKNHFGMFDFNSETDFLLIKTGFCNRRYDDVYHNNYPGISDNLAYYFKKCMPNLKAIGFDMISLSSPLHGDLGKKAHTEFLINHDILIVEDMDLTELNVGDKIDQIIVSPLLYENADGAPVTVFFK